MKKGLLIASLCIFLCGIGIAAENVSVNESKNLGEVQVEHAEKPVELLQENSQKTQADNNGNNIEKSDIKKIELVKIPCSKFGAYPACKYEEISVETSDNPVNLNWHEANAVCEAKEMRLPTSSELHSMLMAAQEGIIHPFQSANYWADSVDEENANICYMGFGNCDKRNKQESQLPFRCVEK